MQEKTLYQISIIMILVGLAILMIYAEELDLKAIERIETVAPAEAVKMYGTITKLSVQENTLFLEVEGSRVEKTNVMVFSDEELFLEEGDYVEISGVVEKYQGQSEIIASKVVKK
ncbi:MAG: hypothetical protein AABX04_02040 [Nanoarchaeota archaeon]